MIAQEDIVDGKWTLVGLGTIKRLYLGEGEGGVVVVAVAVAVNLRALFKVM